MSQIDPLTARPLPGPRRDAMRQQLEAIVAEQRGPRRGHKTTVIGGAVLIAALGTGAAAFVYVEQSQPVTNKTEARCYTVASLEGGNQFHGTTIAAAGRPGSKAQVDAAASVCAALWRQGFLLPGAAGITSPHNTTTRHRVPSLVACVMPDGTAAVFPGNRQTCTKLGLPLAQK
jgi:hypothetical protein